MPDDDGLCAAHAPTHAKIRAFSAFDLCRELDGYAVGEWLAVRYLSGLCVPGHGVCGIVPFEEKGYLGFVVNSLHRDRVAGRRIGLLTGDYLGEEVVVREPGPVPGAVVGNGRKAAFDFHCLQNALWLRLPPGLLQRRGTIGDSPSL